MLFAFWIVLSADAHAQVYYAKEMTTEHYRTLDRSRTVVIMPDGILEEHGPYLPAYTDGYITERLVQDVSAAIVEKGWNALILPTIPLGSGGANELAAKYPFPGTLAVRASTLRALLMDWATELGDAGFRWIFVANDHGAPNHNRILDQVCEYFSETYGGHMTVLRGIRTSSTAKTDEELRNMLSKKAREEDAASGHAGIGETSLMLFLQPKLVDPAYKDAPPQTAPGFDDMLQLAKRESWPGYFGSPRFSSAAYGAKMYKSRSEQAIEQALKTLDATAPQAPRFGTAVSPVHSAALKRDEEIEKKQQEWLKKKGLK
jgi:creatinine amidohydrolase/Fe(II)-dependent formamide hydrolase-like protein